MRQLCAPAGRNWATLQLTLDAALQNYAAQRMGTESAAAVITDCQTGELLTICSSPSFDPNKFVRGISSPEYRALMDHDHRPLADKTVQGVYPPGSTFKMVTLMAGLEAGVIDAGTRFYCPGHTELGGRRFHCWRRGGHGTVDAIKGLEESRRLLHEELAQRVGIDRIAIMARKLGLGQRHDLPMSAVAEGIAPDREWKMARHGQAWQIGDSLNASIGQGFVLASPLQLAVMTARIASGREVRPQLIRSVDGVRQAPPEDPPLDISPESLRVARLGMDAVMNSARGTARGARITREEWRMAGKTGTSQVRNITAAERARGVISNDQLPWERRDHALFVAYAPMTRAEIRDLGGGRTWRRRIGRGRAHCARHPAVRAERRAAAPGRRALGSARRAGGASQRHAPLPARGPAPRPQQGVRRCPISTIRWHRFRRGSARSCTSTGRWSC